MRVRNELAIKFTLALAFAAFFLGFLFVATSGAQEPNRKTFNSPDEAGNAFFAAEQSENDQALLAILGTEGKEIISSGDPLEDMDERVGFVVKYQQMHRYIKNANGTTTLYVGSDEQPFPIPLVSKNAMWFFDTAAGKEEILSRRIARNELAAINASRQLVLAEKQYYQKPYNGEPHYTARFVSDKGKHNGLFWLEAGDESDSSIDPRIAKAGHEIQKAEDADDPIPFNGYYFRILTGQGKSAPGGSRSYLLDGAVLSSFAFVAYPARYRSSGVMTLIVNQRGEIYEKDLGPNTTALANGMTEYDPDSTWRRVN